MLEESSIVNSMEIIKKPVYRSIEIPINESFKPPILPFYWKLNNLSQIINIENSETFIENTKSFIQTQNILFEFDQNTFTCKYYDNEINEIINFNLYFWSQKQLNSNQFIFEFNCMNIYNFNNIFRIYEIYNNFCILFNAKPIEIKLLKFNENNKLIHTNEISPQTIEV